MSVSPQLEQASDLPLSDLLDGATPISYSDGTHRSIEPCATVRRLTPYLERFGITRVANITGLDRVGIPVYAVVRPNARSLSVSQGKGLNREAARASAIGESIEAHHAEYAGCPLRIETYAQLRRMVSCAVPEDLPHSRGSRYRPSLPIPWAEGFDLLAREPFWVPFELVHANATHPRVPGSGCFLCTTNGLASGNTLAEAVLHGLCEVVERDAMALWHQRTPDGRAATCVDLATLCDPACRWLLGQLEDASLDLMLWDARSDIPLPVYRAVISDRRNDPVIAPLPAAAGAGCHPDPAIAATRAITEAAQSRLTVIAGARDDLTRERYRVFQSAESLAFHRRLARSWQGCVAFPSAAEPPEPTIERELARVLAAIASAGFDRIAAVDLSRPGVPLKVVRTIVPGLEGAIESPYYRPGRRAMALRG